MTIVTPEQMRAAREPTHAVDPALNPKYPHSGLSVEETDLLEREGWHETGFESLPPPWAKDDEPRVYHPKDALKECLRGLALLELRRDLVLVSRAAVEPAPASLDLHGIRCVLAHASVVRRFAPAYLARLVEAVTACLAEDFARALALLTSPIAQPTTPLDLDAVLREIARKGVEVRFRPEGDVSVYRIDSDKALVGTGPTVDTAVRDLAGQSLALRKRERDGLCGSLDAATKRHDTLASLLGDAAKTPTC